MLCHSNLIRREGEPADFVALYQLKLSANSYILILACCFSDLLDEKAYIL